MPNRFGSYDPIYDALRTLSLGNSPIGGPSGSGSISSGTIGRLAEYVAEDTLQASTLIKSGAGILTLSAASDYTLTAPKTGTLPVGTGTAGRVAEWVTDANTLQASTLIKSGAGVLTLSAASTYTATFPTTGTVAMMYVDNSGSFGLTGTLYVDYLFPRSNTFVQIKTDTEVNNDMQNVVSLYRSVTGGAAAGFGARLIWSLDSSTNLTQQAATIDALWNVATHASRVADLVLSAAYSGGLSEGLRIRGGSGVALGLFGVTPVVRPATGGSAATFVQNSGNAVNDASTIGGYTLGQVIQALQNIGLLT